MKSLIRYLLWFVGGLVVIYAFSDVATIWIYYFGIMVGGLSYMLTERKEG